MKARSLRELRSSTTTAGANRTNDSAHFPASRDRATLRWITEQSGRPALVLGRRPYWARDPFSE